MLDKIEGLSEDDIIATFAIAFSLWILSQRWRSLWILFNLNKNGVW